MAQLFLDSKKENIVASLAVELGLGGLYAEEVCLLSGIDKSTNPKNAGSHIKPILDSLRKLMSHEIEPAAYFEGEKVIDFAPFPLTFYQSKQSKKYESFSGAVAFFYSQFIE